MNVKRAICQFFSLFIIASAPALASEGPPPALNPATYVSPSGPFLADGGKQLWFVDCAGLTLHKFLIPRADSPPTAK
jgi:hypothetical protein